MKKLKTVLTCMILALLAASPAQCADLKIIGNPDMAAASLSTEDLKGVFLGTKTSLPGGGRVEPVLGKSGPAHEAFVKEYLGKTDAALQTYYRSLVFTGKGSMPKVLDSEADIVAYVAKTKGAIGYVSAAANTAAVKTIAVK